MASACSAVRWKGSGIVHGKSHRIDGKEAFAYHAASQRIESGGGHLKPIDGRVSVRILIDRSLIETFCNDGQMLITQPFEKRALGNDLSCLVSRLGARRARFQETHD